jgi:predicted GTPase
MVAPVGHGYESTTRDMQSIVVEMDRRTCTIVDSPGFDDTDQDENSDYNILDKITRWLQITYVTHPFCSKWGENGTQPSLIP